MTKTGDVSTRDNIFKEGVRFAVGARRNVCLQTYTQIYNIHDMIVIYSIHTHIYIYGIYIHIYNIIII